MRLPARDRPCRGIAPARRSRAPRTRPDRACERAAAAPRASHRSSSPGRPLAKHVDQCTLVSLIDAGDKVAAGTEMLREDTQAGKRIIEVMKNADRFDAIEFTA